MTVMEPRCICDVAPSDAEWATDEEMMALQMLATVIRRGLDHISPGQSRNKPVPEVIVQPEY